MKNYLYFIYISLLAFVLVTEPCFGNSRSWIQIDKKPSELCTTIEIIESNEMFYKVKVKIHKIQDEIINVNGVTFHRLALDDDITLQEEGCPALPVITQHIGLPSGSTYTKDISEEVWKDVTIEKIYPTQKPRTGISDDTTFVINDSVYNSQLYRSSLQADSEIMTWKGINNFIMTLCPFKYYPMENKLSVLSEFTLTITFSAEKRKTSSIQTVNEQDLEVFNNKNFFSANNDDQRKTIHRTYNDNYDYLIIIGNIPEIENSQKLRDFRKWKALKGLKTKVASTDTIGIDSASIKSFIAQEYNAYNIKYVLFVGDHTKIPLPVFTSYHSQSDHPVNKSDYWYGCMDGATDTQAEIPIGRFVANNISQFTNMVNKTIMYESTEHEWSNRVLLSAHQQHDNYAYYQGPMDEIRTSTYSEPMSFFTAYGASIENGGDGANAAYVYNKINNGINIVSFNGHGNYNAWYLGPHGREWDVHQADTTEMNSGTSSLFVTSGCFNGDFTENESILSSYTRSEKCAVAFCGNSVAMYTTPAHKYHKQFYSLLLNEKVYHLGYLNISAHLRCFDMGDIAKDNAFCFISGGDPSLEIWTGGQKTFSDYRFTVSNDNLEITVVNIDSFSVNVVSAEGALLECYNSMNNNTITMPLPAIDCEIALDKHNYVPLIIHYRNQFVQNEIIKGDAVIAGTPVEIGYDVTTAKEFGNVIIEPNARVTIYKGSGGITIKNGFECKKGAKLEIK